MASIFDLFKRGPKNMIYLSAGEDGTWSASVAPVKGGSAGVAFVEEKNYPADLYYRHVDINGSSMLTMDTCYDRAELLESLNWLGQSRNAIESLWDFDGREPIGHELADIFNAAAKRKGEIDKAAAEEFLAAFEAQKFPKDPEVWITVYKHIFGVLDDKDNLTEICVPTDWLCNVLRAEGETPEEWFSEYTADWTMDIAEKALQEGVISGCSDPGIKIPSISDKALKPSLDSQISQNSGKTTSGNTPKNTPSIDPER